jgi:hypothetical protein
VQVAKLAALYATLGEVRGRVHRPRLQSSAGQAQKTSNVELPIYSQNPPQAVEHCRIR